MSFVIRIFWFVLGFWKFVVRYSGLSVGWSRVRGDPVIGSPGSRKRPSSEMGYNWCNSFFGGGSMLKLGLPKITCLPSRSKMQRWSLTCFSCMLMLVFVQAKAISSRVADLYPIQFRKQKLVVGGRSFPVGKFYFQGLAAVWGAWGRKPPPRSLFWNHLSWICLEKVTFRYIWKNF